jgi:type IX secretion system PorP/SprF family membrane protein
MKGPILLFLSFSIAFGAMCQTLVNFSQRMASPTYYFPELAGWHGGMQVATQYRNQWPGIPASLVTYNASVDGYADKLHSGFALNFGHDRIGTGLITTNSVEFSWSPKINFKNGLTLMPALSGKYFQTNVNWAQIKSGNSLTQLPYEDFAGSPATSTVNKLSAGGGIGAIYKETFFAAHVHDLNQPMLSFFPADELRLLRTYSFIAGRVFTYNKVKITPNVSYLKYGSFNLITMACNAQYKWAYIGAKYGFYGLAGASLGAEIKERVRISYSYDLTTSRLAITNLGSHELALRFWFFKDKAKKQFLSNLPLM